MHGDAFRHELREYAEGVAGFVRRVLPWRRFLERQTVGRGRALEIGEPVRPGHNAAERPECHSDEIPLNLAFDGEVGGGRAATDPHPPEPPHQPEPPRPLEGALTPPQARVEELDFAEGELGLLRRFLSEWSLGQQLGVDASEELVLAVNELATNSIRYGGGAGKLRLWREQDTLICEIQDAGHIRDPLVGRSPPAPEQDTGRGLWLVNQLCDLVQIRSSPSGTVVRVHKHRSSDAPG